jgi:hypothetical protein
MNEKTKYWKLLHRKRIIRWNDFFERQDETVARKNRFVRGIWFLVKYPLQSFIGMCLYGNYIGWQFRDFSFDAGYMEYHIQTTGKTVGEALTFLNERNILLKEYVYRDVISKKKRIKAEKSLDYLFTKYDALKENKISNSERTQTQWIDALWNRLSEKKCVKEDGKSDFVLIMTGNQPLNQVVWYKGLKWLVQFVREGIAVKKIKVRENMGSERFVIGYIMRNFCPNPDLPNQKAERYTEERIKAAANENLKDKIKEMRYFVFD